MVVGWGREHFGERSIEQAKIGKRAGHHSPDLTAGPFGMREEQR